MFAQSVAVQGRGPKTAIGLMLAAVAAGLCACTSVEPARRSATRIGAGMGAAVTAPLEDLNVKRVEIPPVLTRARLDPYSLDKMSGCEMIAAEVGKLDEALGPDMDEPPPPLRTRAEKAADFTADQTLNLVKDTASDLVPFRGWVRRLSGAERHRRDVQEAIKAGSMRRSYLKGVGMRNNCAPPAAPSWFKPERRALLADQPLRSSRSKGSASRRRR